jgi:hypothetical protein
MVKSEELIGTTEYLTLHTRCRINRCRYIRVRLNFDNYLLINFAQDGGEVSLCPAYILCNEVL